MSKTTEGKATQNFNDSGTGKSFVYGQKYDFDEGVYANYLAGGLVEAVPPLTTSTATTTKA